MVSLQELHSIIRSLNKAEKRFFKLLSATESQAAERALSLFETLDKIREHCCIETRLRNESKLKTGPENVNHLFHLILSSQRNFYSESIKGFALIDEISNLKILFEKAQYRQCRKMLKAAKENALSLEKFSALLQLIEIEKQLLAQEVLDTSYQRMYSALDAEQSRYCELEKNSTVFFTLYGKIRYELKHGEPGKTEFFSETLQRGLLVDPSGALTVKSRFLLHKCRFLCHLALRSLAEARAELSLAEQIMRESNLIFSEMPRQYIDVLFHAARFEIVSSDTSDNISLAELIRISSGGKLAATDLQLKLRSYIFLVQLQVHHNRRAHSEASSLCAEITDFIKGNESLINREDASLLLFAVTNYHIYTLQHQKAYSSLQMLRRYSDKNTHNDLKNYSVLQEYILCYENCNTAQLNLLKPILLKLIRNRSFRKDETHILETLTRMPYSANTESDVEELLKEHHRRYSADVLREKLDLFYMNALNYLLGKAPRMTPGPDAGKALNDHKQLSNTSS